MSEKRPYSAAPHTPAFTPGQAQISQRNDEKKLLQLLKSPRPFPGNQTEQLFILEREGLINKVPWPHKDHLLLSEPAALKEPALSLS